MWSGVGGAAPLGCVYHEEGICSRLRRTCSIIRSVIQSMGNNEADFEYVDIFWAFCHVLLLAVAPNSSAICFVMVQYYTLVSNGC